MSLPLARSRSAPVVRERLTVKGPSPRSSFTRPSAEDTSQNIAASMDAANVGLGQTFDSGTAPEQRQLRMDSDHLNRSTLR